MISTEYGWTDEQILDVPLCRLRQMTTAIAQRQYLADKSHRRLMSWQTRTIAQFIAATVKVEKGKDSPIMDAANKISLDAKEAQELLNAPVEIENKPGSYERLVRGFASSPDGPA